MTPRISVTVDSGDLKREVYLFWLYDSRLTLYLDHYELLARETKRHSWKPKAWYDRLSRRNATLKEEVEVPLTEHVIESARQQVVTMLKFAPWPRAGLA